MAQTETEEQGPDRLDMIIADAEAAGKRIKEAASAGGKAMNLSRMLGSEIVPMIVALAKEVADRDIDHEERIGSVEMAIGAAGIGTGHPLAAMPAPAAVELLQKCRGLCEAFMTLETAPTPDMKEQARGIAIAIDMAFHQAGELEDEAEAETEEPEASTAPEEQGDSDG